MPPLRIRVSSSVAPLMQGRITKSVFAVLLFSSIRPLSTAVTFVFKTAGILRGFDVDKTTLP